MYDARLAQLIQSCGPARLRLSGGPEPCSDRGLISGKMLGCKIALRVLYQFNNRCCLHIMEMLLRKSKHQ